MNKIEKFWNWFANICHDFGENFDNDALLNELDKRISSLGNLDWEVGPGTHKKNALVISPNGDINLLSYTKEIIACAKGCDDWEYYYATPPKEWDLIFSILSSSSKQKIEVDASKWEYILLKFEDGTYSITIKDSELNKLNGDDQSLILDILLTGILGEEMKMQYIDDIIVMSYFNESEQKRASQMKYLRQHFNQLNLIL